MTRGSATTRTAVLCATRGRQQVRGGASVTSFRPWGLQGHCQRHNVLRRPPAPKESLAPLEAETFMYRKKIISWKVFDATNFLHSLPSCPALMDSFIFMIRFRKKGKKRTYVFPMSVMTTSLHVWYCVYRMFSNIIESQHEAGIHATHAAAPWAAAAATQTVLGFCLTWRRAFMSTTLPCQLSPHSSA